VAQQHIWIQACEQGGLARFLRIWKPVAEGREESAPLVDGEGVQWPVHSFWGCEIVTARSMVSWVTMWEIDVVLSSQGILMSNEL
jgi:hypothetical protein